MLAHGDVSMPGSGLVAFRVGWLIRQASSQLLREAQYYPSAATDHARTAW